MCCGKKVFQEQPRALPRAIPAPSAPRRLPTPPSFLSRAITAPKAPPFAPSNLTIKETSQIHPKCGAKIGVQLRYSDRLRRHYEVKWCPTCKEEVR